MAFVLSVEKIKNKKIKIHFAPAFGSINNHEQTSKTFLALVRHVAGERINN